MTASEADSTKSKARNQERGEDEAGGPLVDWCYRCCFFSASALLFFIPCFSFSPPLPFTPLMNASSTMLPERAHGTSSVSRGPAFVHSPQANLLIPSPGQPQQHPPLRQTTRAGRASSCCGSPTRSARTRRSSEGQAFFWVRDRWVRFM